MPATSPSRTPWREKFQRPQEPRIVDIPPRMTKTWGPGKMLIATPKLVDELVRKVPKRKLVTVAQIMERLARDHHCDSTCPMTTGIFLRIVAEVAEEDRQAGKKRIAPYWRVLKTDGRLNEKYPGGVQQQARFLAAEGHRIERGTRVPKVVDWERRLARL